MMIRRLWWVGVLAACGPACAQAETFETVQKKLTEMQRKITSLTAKIRYHQFLEGAAKNTTTGEGTLEFIRMGDRYYYREELSRVKKIEYKGEVRNEPNTFEKVLDGNFTWLLNVALGQPVVTKQTPPPAPDPNPFKDFEEQYNLTLLPDETISGRPCWVIEATPKPPLKHPWPAFKIRFWYDKDVGVLMKKVTYDLKQKPMTTLTYLDIRTNVPIDQDRFKFTPPPNAKIFDETTATTETMPAPPDGK